MLTVTPIPAFNDNYLWLIENESECWVVDPGDATPVKAALESRGKSLTGILVTHHHRDHIGGIEELLTPGMQVIGPHENPFPLVNNPVHQGQILNVCGVEFTAIEVPGHTLNHLAYFAQPQDQPPMLFCGDTLFSGGCGRLFEGTAKQMYESLNKLQDLPDETLVYCAHEYTMANLHFAISLEPQNNLLQERIKQVSKMREQNIPSIPSTISIEKSTNPFLRVESSELIQNALKFNAQSEATPSDIFATIRKMKDQF